MLLTFLTLNKMLITDNKPPCSSCRLFKATPSCFWPQHRSNIYQVDFGRTAPLTLKQPFEGVGTGPHKDSNELKFVYTTIERHEHTNTHTHKHHDINQTGDGA